MADILCADTWENYALIDAGDGEKLERWNDVLLCRPDPVAIWPKDEKELRWQQCDAVYHRSVKGGGYWEMKRPLASSWTLAYRNLNFKIAPTGFKHTGLFPEQAVNWEWMSGLIHAHRHEELRILNLFAYTGAATMATSIAGAKEVVHVDASKGMVQWAKENMRLSHLEKNTVRFITDDCLKFVEREKRRGHTYHGILMDPPSYGRGPDGELWKFEKEIGRLLQACIRILDTHALFLLINSYTAGISASVLENLLRCSPIEQIPNARITAGEIGIPMTSRNMILPCGIYGRWERL